jgi:hypothetical protein
MRLRRIISLFLLLGAAFLLTTSVILYISPAGRVAYWAEWKLWGLTKSEWTNLHINLGLFLLIAAFLHVCYNWKAILAYLKNHSKQIVVFTGDFVVAAALGLVILVGTHYGILPFKWIQSLNEKFEAIASSRYGEPPYGHAELSTLETLARRLDLNLSKSIDRLEEKGFVGVDPKATLADISAANQITPQALFDEMQSRSSDQDEGIPAGLPKIPPPGMGKMKLIEICEKNGLDIQNILSRLAAGGIQASAEQTLKEIADQNDTSPGEIYEALRGSVNK